MRRDQIFPAFGAVFLLVCFTASLLRVVLLKVEESAPNKVSLTIAHTHLQPGVREAFAVVIAEYEARHANITVKQMPVPERVYNLWMETKLFGGNAPDIILMQGDQEIRTSLGIFCPWAGTWKKPIPIIREPRSSRIRPRRTGSPCGQPDRVGDAAPAPCPGDA